MFPETGLSIPFPCMPGLLNIKVDFHKRYSKKVIYYYKYC